MLVCPTHRWGRAGLLLLYCFLIVGLAIGMGPAAAEKRALVIGIADYVSQPDLRGPGNDATLMRDLLTGWYGYSRNEVTVLTGKDAKRTDIEREITRLQSTATPDVVAIYYSGHGTVVYSRGVIEEAIVPHDGDPDKPETLITVRELRHWLEKIPAGQVDLVLDCCYSGGFTKDPTTSLPLKCVFPSTVPDDAVQVLEKTLVVSRPGHTVISASASGMNVPDTEFPLVDGTRLRVSALAFFLYKELTRDPATNPDVLVESLRQAMSRQGVDQKPAWGGQATGTIFGGPKRGLSAGLLPVAEQQTGYLQILGGTALDVESGTRLDCLDKNGKVVKSGRVLKSDWRKSHAVLSGRAPGIVAVRPLLKK